MARPRTRRRDDRVERKPKKRVSILDSEQITYVDYKDVNLLRRFMSERAKIRARRVTGNDTQQQREIARAIQPRDGVAAAWQRAPGDAPQQGPSAATAMTAATAATAAIRGDRGDRATSATAGERAPSRCRGVEELEVLSMSMVGDAEGMENGGDAPSSSTGRDDE
jgi:small subunit ribosomal protein S18